LRFQVISNRKVGLRLSGWIGLGSGWRPFGYAILPLFFGELPEAFGDFGPEVIVHVLKVREAYGNL
jgi:hypothetical protein